MRKWIKTIHGHYLNSSHIRKVWIQENVYVKKWVIMVQLESLLVSDGSEANASFYTIESLDTREEAYDVLEEIINGHEMEGG